MNTEILEHTEDKIEKYFESMPKGTLYLLGGIVLLAVIVFAIRSKAGSNSSSVSPLQFSGGYGGGNSTSGGVTNGADNANATSSLADTLSAQLKYQQGIADINASSAANAEALNEKAQAYSITNKAANADETLREQNQNFNFQFSPLSDTGNSGTLLGSSVRNMNVSQTGSRTQGVLGAIKNMLNPSAATNNSGLPAEDNAVLGSLSNSRFGTMFAASNATSLFNNNLAVSNAKTTTSLQQALANNTASNQLNLLSAQGDQQRKNIDAQEKANQNLLNSQKKSTCKSFLGFGCGEQGFASTWGGAADTAVSVFTGGKVNPRDNAGYGTSSNTSSIGGFTPNFVPNIRINPINGNKSGSGSVGNTGNMFDYNYTPNSDPFNMQSILNGGSSGTLYA